MKITGNPQDGSVKAVTLGSPLAPDQGKAKDKIILDLSQQLEGKDSRAEYLERELSNARRLFMELYGDHRTLKLRFGWLEDAARDAVTSCPDHVGENMDRLADELGLEITAGE